MTGLIVAACNPAEFCEEAFTSSAEIKACGKGAGSIAETILDESPAIPDETQGTRHCAQGCDKVYKKSDPPLEAVYEACVLSCQTRIAHARYQSEKEKSAAQGGFSP